MMRLRVLKKNMSPMRHFPLNLKVWSRSRCSRIKCRQLFSQARAERQSATLWKSAAGSKVCPQFKTETFMWMLIPSIQLKVPPIDFSPSWVVQFHSSNDLLLILNKSKTWRRLSGSRKFQLAWTNRCTCKQSIWSTNEVIRLWVCVSLINIMPWKWLTVVAKVRVPVIKVARVPAQFKMAEARAQVKVHSQVLARISTSNRYNVWVLTWPRLIRLNMSQISNLT
jgi:hypothetical protein